VRDICLLKFGSSVKTGNCFRSVRFQVITAASMKLKIVFWDVLPCKIIVDRRFRGTLCLRHKGWLFLIKAARTFEMSVDNYFTRQYIPEDKSELRVFTVLPKLKKTSISFP
jgi:hypothetical protein